MRGDVIRRVPALACLAHHPVGRGACAPLHASPWPPTQLIWTTPAGCHSLLPCSYNQRNHVCLQHKVADGFLRLVSCRSLRQRQQHWHARARLAAAGRHLTIASTAGLLAAVSGAPPLARGCPFLTPALPALPTLQGVQVRFCQRCGVAHPLADFDGLKKSCRRQLAVHNSRRRKASAAAPTAEAAAEAPAAPAPRLEPPAAPPAPPAVVPQAAESLPPLPMEADLAPVQAPPAAAASGASLGASPSVSVGSAMSDAGPDSWLLLADSDSGGGGGGVAWDEGDAELAAALGLSPLELAAPIAAPADERVCGATDERVCGVCCAPTACRGCDAGVDAAGGSGAAGLAAAPVRAGGAADGAAGRSGCLGGAAVAPEQPASGPPSRSGDAAGAGPASSGLLGVTSPAAAAEAAEAAAEAPAGSPAAVAALEQLQQGNAALYHVFVQQQLLAAQALITTAGALLNRQLPLMRSGSTASVCSVATC